MHNLTATPEELKGISRTLMDSYQKFLFLSEVFGAIEATEVTVKLSSDGAAGLAKICGKAAENLLDAYGLM